LGDPIPKKKVNGPAGLNGTRAGGKKSGAASTYWGGAKKSAQEVLARAGSSTKEAKHKRGGGKNERTQETLKLPTGEHPSPQRKAYQWSLQHREQ